MTSNMWYIDKGFLIWIIPLTYPSRESMIWAYTTSFVHTCIFNVFIACLFILKLSTPFSVHAFWFRLIDIHLFTWFRIYWHSFNFLYVTCHCLYLYAWTTSLDHVHMWLPEHANWLYHMYLAGCILTTLDPHVQILESGSWWPYCSWSECATEAWIKSCLSGPSFFQLPLVWLARFSSFYSWVLFCMLYCTSYFYASWWSYILEILYHALW